MGNLPICHCQLCWAEAMFQVIQLLNFRPIYVEITSKPAPIHAVEKSALKIDAKNVKKTAIYSRLWQILYQKTLQKGLSFQG